jgi:hypothetical protein
MLLPNKYEVHLEGGGGLDNHISGLNRTGSLTVKAKCIIRIGGMNDPLSARGPSGHPNLGGCQDLKHENNTLISPRGGQSKPEQHRLLKISQGRLSYMCSHTDLISATVQHRTNQ